MASNTVAARELRVSADSNIAEGYNIEERTCAESHKQYVGDDSRKVRDFEGGR